LGHAGAAAACDPGCSKLHPRTCDATARGQARLGNERPASRRPTPLSRALEVIGERPMLIVIDDVWQAVHARPFLQAGFPTG
jgi:hypothetical protein